MPVISVTPGALSATAADLRRTAGALAALARGPQGAGDATGCGSPELEAAVDGFLTAWARSCGRLAADAERTAALLAAAADLYAGAERTALALTGATTPAAPAPAHPGGPAR